MWFMTVDLTSASVAGEINPLSSETVNNQLKHAMCTGLHLLPNSFCMSLGSLFSGYGTLSFSNTPRMFDISMQLRDASHW